MKKRALFSLCLHEENSLAVKLTEQPGKTDDSQSAAYQVAWLEPIDAGDNSPTRCLKELSQTGSSVCQLLPAGEAALLITSLPPMKRKQTEASLQGVLQREKGGQLGEWAVDYRTLPPLAPTRGAQAATGPQGNRDLSALFISKEIRDRQYEQAVARGIRPRSLQPDFLVLSQLFQQHPPCDVDEDAWNLVHLGATQRFQCVGDAHGLLFTRPLPADLSEGDSHAEYVERLAAEVERSNLFAHQAARSLEVQHVAVCGDPELADALVAKLAERERYHVVPWRAEELFSTEDGVADWRQLISLAAAAVADQSAAYDLLPPEVKAGKQRALQRHALMAATTLAVAVIPFLLAGGKWTSGVQEEILKDNEKKMTYAEWRVGEAAAAYLHDRVLHSRQNNIQVHAFHRPDLSELLADLAGRTPPSVIYTLLDIVEDAPGNYRLLLHGESRARDGTRAHATFLKFLSALKQSSQIEQVAEPTYLEINGEEEDGPPRSKVVFALEYRVKGQQADTASDSDQIPPDLDRPMHDQENTKFGQADSELDPEEAES